MMCTRVAVDTGEAVERDGDYFGPAMNRAAGLRGAAHCGEVVATGRSWVCPRWVWSASSCGSSRA